MTRQQRLEAMRAGRDAGRAGEPITSCPYPAAGTPDERALASAWTREYLRSHPTAAGKVDYTG